MSTYRNSHRRRASTARLAAAMAVASLLAALATLSAPFARGAGDPGAIALSPTIGDRDASGVYIAKPVSTQAELGEAKAQLASEPASDDQIDRLTERVRELERERDELLTRLTPQHPQVVEIGIQIEIVGRRLDDLQEAARAAKLSQELEFDNRLRQRKPTAPPAVAAEPTRESAPQQASPQELLDSPTTADRQDDTAPQPEAASAEPPPPVTDPAQPGPAATDTGPEPAVPRPQPTNTDPQPADPEPEPADDAPGPANASLTQQPTIIESEPIESAAEAEHERAVPRVDLSDPNFPPPPITESQHEGSPRQHAEKSVRRDTSGAVPNGRMDEQDEAPLNPRAASSSPRDSYAERSAAPIDDPAAAHQRPDRSKPSHESQPMALFALVVALVVAAVAAILLARANGDTLFTSVEEVGTALSLPIVGVISPGEAPAAAGRRGGMLSHATWLVVQIVVAVAVFALVAYAVQTPDFLSRVFSNPQEVLARATRLAGC